MKSRFGSQVSNAEVHYSMKQTQTSLLETLLTDTGIPDAQSVTNPATLNDSPSAVTYTTQILV